MCGPVAVGVAMVAMSAMQAYSQNRDAKFQSEVANMNADISERAADDSINRGNVEAAKQRSRARQLAGTQAATMSANGVDLGAGGALDIFGDTAAMGELDALTVMNNASREAYGYQTSALNSRLEGQMAKQRGKSGVTQTILTTPLKAYGAYQMTGGTWSPFSSSSSLTSSATTGTGSNMFKNMRSGFF
ncbi:virion core protein, T7 gp14 family [Morganella morganii]|uniref:virion core protein, T7 gp14 family n=1 Tax=Morganella morganii TaxID=582 RepID=UPI003EBF617E